MDMDKEAILEYFKKKAKKEQQEEERERQVWLDLFEMALGGKRIIFDF